MAGWVEPVITMLSKSGSNEFHGHGWYYFRDEGFDAAGFFANKVGSPKLPVNYQILGGSVGGPLVKDRTFFHAHYERFNDDFERVAFLTVPSAGMLAGDFSGAGPTGQIPQLLQPAQRGGRAAAALRQQPDPVEHDEPGVPGGAGCDSSTGAQRVGERLPPTTAIRTRATRG